MAGSRRKAAAVVVATLSVGLVACDALLGLGQYQDVACAFNCDAGEAGSDAAEAGTVPAPESGPDADASADTGADADASADTGVVTFPDSGPPVPTGHELWAHWPMPNPDASIGPESSTPLPHAMSYDAGADAGGAIAYDVVTGLSWLRAPQAASTYPQAWLYCGKVKGWRVPTRIELVSLIDFAQPSGTPTIDPAMFPTVLAVRTWTSSAVAGSTSAYWSVDFATGLTASSGTATQVVCVSGGTP